MIRVLVLGAAAGGGFPQWNSNSDACRRVRTGDPQARPSTQASVAVSVDAEHWHIVNASPDLRAQINCHAQLHPRDGLRSTPISTVVLTNADVDAIAGLLNLRERTRFRLYGHPRVLHVLDQNPIFGVLAPGVVDRASLELNKIVTLQDGLIMEPFPVPGKIALFMEEEKPESFGTEEGDTIGLEFRDHAGTRVLFVGNCAAVTPELRRRMDGAAVVFFDGTLWRDDEMLTSGEGAKTGHRMGHISISGVNGVVAALANADIGRRIFIHINNTNPVLLGDSAERAMVEAQGWEVAYDGMEVCTK